MWEAIKGICCFIGLAGVVIAVLLMAWSISIAFRIIAVLIAIGLVVGFCCFALADWFSSKLKK